MNGLLNLVQQLSQWIVGPFGIATIALAVTSMFIAAACHFVGMRAGFIALACGAFAYSASWAVSLITGGA